MSTFNRRDFLKSTAVAGSAAMAAVGATASLSSAAAQDSGQEKKFKISLAAWSLHNTFRTLWHNFDLPRICSEDFGLDGLEFVSNFFDLPSYASITELKRRAEHYGVNMLLIMVDSEGDMSHPDRKERMQAATNHRKWVDIAHFLGCHSIRCNFGYNQVGTPDERVDRAAESFNALLEYSEGSALNVIIENHGGVSSMPDKLISLMKKVDNPRFGTLPDFGNFTEVDKFEGIKALMPYAKKAVSAKCYDFEPDGSHKPYSLDRMMEIVLAAGYNGYVGIEFEGHNNAWEGVMACKRILERHQ
jgi:L-ribulose-5-phosphate 3-epimerase